MFSRKEENQGGVKEEAKQAKTFSIKIVRKILEKKDKKYQKYRFYLSDVRFNKMQR